ncbi:hypothetical protein F4779DRAFT_612549 [Xylariaceae sp. FL0662B]|nr:hypothetical protein F4779DRAFT_612549 [Xylariaceae sp. FL0662B]
MQLYNVIIVPRGTGVVEGNPVVLLVPASSGTIVLTFIEDLWNRLARQNISFSADTHTITLHRDSKTGPIIDFEDVLSDVVMNPQDEKLFAVVTEKADEAASHDLESSAVGNSQVESDTLSIRISTPSSIHEKDTCPILEISPSASIGELHRRVGECLGIVPTSEENVESYECNCTLGNKIADCPSETTHFLVIHGKSIVERIPLQEATKGALMEALLDHFSHDLETRKMINILGALLDSTDTDGYKKIPVVTVCSRQRHTPITDQISANDDTGKQKSKVLDLHTSEVPIHPSCFRSTLEEAGFRRLAAEDGVIDMFAVHRTTAGEALAAVGKSSIFRSRAHWEPKVAQSDRGMAMFLSSLRVFASIVQGKKDDERFQDAVLYVFTLFTRFPPALRCLHMLFEGKTITAVESAALSHAVFGVLPSFVLHAIIKSDDSRVFEGARLFFGFVLETAKALKLPATDDPDTKPLPYLLAFHTVDIRDHMTAEGVMHAVQTPDGLVEESLFDAFKMAVPLAESPLQTFMVEEDINPDTARYALLSGGTTPEITVFSVNESACRDLYGKFGNISEIVDPDQLQDLGHLAELCGKHKLSVYRPTQLTSAITPCLTFDRNAHLAVYTGEQPCQPPGKSSIAFRPKHGEEIIDPAIIEPLIAPILNGYQADGTAVFDAVGGAELRRLLTPDEVVMFCVDCSTSMGIGTNFDGIGEDGITKPEDESLVEPEFYGRASVEDVKGNLLNDANLDDMVAMIARTTQRHRRQVTYNVLQILRTMISSEIASKSDTLEKKRSAAQTFYHLREGIPRLEAELEKLKSFWAGLKTHKEHIEDFLIYRALYPSRAIEQNWTWSFGDAIPAFNMSQVIPSLPEDIVHLPERLLCPISHTLMEDAVMAVDGYTYSDRAILQWFTIRESSPTDGSEIHNRSLHVNKNVRRDVARWIGGDGLCWEGPYQHPKYITVIFDSDAVSFHRLIRSSISLNDLYKVAFRGLKGRYTAFQLWTERTHILEPSSLASLSSYGFRNGDHVTINLRDGTPRSGITLNPSMDDFNDKCLVKVYGGDYRMLFSYWVKKDTTKSFASVIWKYWRHKFSEMAMQELDPMVVWTDVLSSGDGFFYGDARDSFDQLATYLTQRHCSGRLAPEKLFYKDYAIFDSNESREPLVLKVYIRKRQPEPACRGLSRLDVLKQMFNALINRMLAYNYKTHVGLISFSNYSRVAMPISHVLENFRRATVDMAAIGDTALWDSLALAGDQLKKYARKYPGVKKRIICISDGKDTNSKTNRGHDIYWNFLRKDIVVDSVCLGNEDNEDLRTLSYLLGSYRFHPQSLVSAMTICEMEPFLSLTERPPITLPRIIPKNHLQVSSYFIQSRSRASATVVSDDIIPPRREHPNLGDAFLELTAVNARYRNNDRTVGNARPNLRTSRLMREMQAVVVNGPHPKYDIYVSESDISFWKIVMEGPDGSPYSEGTFLFYLHADDGYPIFAPKARFVTKIKHPNINAHGRICHSIFDRDWTSDIGMATLLQAVYGLLYQPEHSDPVNTTTALGFHHHEVEFANEVREHVRKHALQTRDTTGSSGDEEEDKNEEDMDPE